MIQRALDHGFRGRAAELLEDVLFDRAGVDADADGEMALLCSLHDRLHAVRAADVAGVQADLVHARLDGGKRQTVVKMDIRHDRNGRACADLAQRLRRRFVRHRASYDVAACLRERTDLCERRFRVARVRVRHGLDGDGRAAADRNAADVNLFCQFHIYPSFEANTGRRMVSCTPCVDFTASFCLSAGAGCRVP